MFLIIPAHLIFILCIILPFFFNGFPYLATAGMAFTVFVVVWCENSGENAAGVASAFSVMLSVTAIVMQPYLLQHLIKFRLVLLKGAGRI